MKEVLYQFSMGTTGSVPVPSPTEKRRSPTKRYYDRSNSVGSKRFSSMASSSAKSVYSELDDGVLIEELNPQEVMLPAGKAPKDMSYMYDQDDDAATYTTGTSFMREPFTGRLHFKHTFLPVHNFGVTKQDQYQKIKAFESSVLRKKDSSEQNVLSGVRAVEHHERRLQEELTAYNLTGMGPNFHKLQVYSNIFEDMIEDSPTFAYILRCIKTEYDNYIAKLLDSQTAQHHLLRDQVQQMAARGTSRPKELQQVMSRLESLEGEAKILLEKNDRMREEVREETEWLSATPEAEPTQMTTPTRRDEPRVELADEIEHVKALILEKLDAVNALRVMLRDECVPLTVCTHLEQCIKETEIEVQKLLKQNEYYERSIAEMDHDLKEAIIEADTSEKDAKRIWRKVNSTRGLPGVKPSSSQPQSDDDDEESKWNWYIS